jgi:signal transduction histidine kinase
MSDPAVARTVKTPAKAADPPRADTGALQADLRQSLHRSADEPGPHSADPAGAPDVTVRLHAVAAAADGLVGLGAEGKLSPAAALDVARALSETTGVEMDEVCLLLYSRAVTSPRLLELPPLTAIGVQLHLLLDLGVFDDVSTWRESSAGEIECVLQLGGQDPARRVRTEARSVLRGRRGTRAGGRSSLCSVAIVQYEQAIGVVVGHASRPDTRLARAYLDEAARALVGVLERERLLERSRDRETALVTSAERRLTRLAYDLHDGPIQDVLALAADVRYLEQQLLPFMLESHRELAAGRFDDLSGRLAELDRVLRGASHSLESKSVVRRPLGEILHREVDAFADRSSITARLELRGDPESVDSAQRVVIFRAVQEALANVREHSAASTVDIRVWARRSWIEVQIVDNGAGFEVGRALANAAKRGRLGLVGIGERVRLLGGTLTIDSRPGGPTTLSFTLPR